MIRVLRLVSFGKFTSKEFALSKTSLFVGRGESGKTTLFDALAAALCRPAGNTAEGKMLRARYGDISAGVQIEADDGGLQIAKADFYGVHAVRAGDIRFGADASGAAWVRKLKGRMFTAGVDLESIAEELEKLASDDRRYAQNRELEELTNEYAAKSRELENKRAERQRILGGEANVEKLKHQISGLDDKIEAEEKRLAELQQRLKGQKKKLERGELERLRRRLDEYLRATKELSEMEPFASDRSAKLSELIAAVADCEKQLVSLKDRHADLSRRREAADLECAGLEKQNIACEPAAECCKRLRARVERFCDKRPVISKTSWRMLPLGMAAVFFLAGVICLLALDAPSGPIGAAIGAGLALILVFVARRTRQVADKQAEADFIAGVREEWNFKYADIQKLQATTTQGLATFFDEIRLGFETIERRLREKKVAEIDDQAALDDIARKIEDAESRLEQQRQKTQDWLAKLGLKTADEYIAKRARYEDLTQAIEKRKKELEDELGGTAPEEALAEIDRKLAVLDEEGIESKDASAAELNRLELEVQAVRANRARLAEDRQKAAQTLGESSGQIRGELKGLPEQILKIENEHSRLRAEIDAKERDKQAARIAADLFEELSKDSDRQMEEITKGMKEYLRIITGAERDAAIGDLDEEDLAAQDAGGRLRPAGQLSESTRDAIVLAARLALAQRVEGLQKLLILDEPFLTLDPQREQRALEMVRAFQEKNDFQLIFFTKEARVREKIEAVFDDVTVHDLDAAG